MRGQWLRWVAAVERGVWGRVGGPVSEARNFLLLQYPLAVGTAVHATPLVRALAEAVPGCRMAVAASGVGLEVFRHHPLVERVVVTASPLEDVWGASRDLRRARVFGGEPYLVVTSNGNQRTRVAMAAMLAGGRDRVGFTEAPEMYRVGLRFDAGVSQIANNLRVVGALGHRLAREVYEPEVFFTGAELARARVVLEAEGVDVSQAIVVLVTQTSATQRKGWRAERFREVAASMHERWGAQVVFVGSAAERGAIDVLREGLGFRAANVAGRTSLTELCALLSLCDVGVTLDTGTLHLGRAVGLPMAVIAPAWSPVGEWLPVGDERFAILKNGEIAAAPEGYVIDEVSVGEVMGALERLLGRFPLLGRMGRRGLVG